MDDITVVVAQVKTVAVPDEVDLQSHSILVQKQHRFIIGNMCYFRVVT
jgi:hypothetical protein